MKTSELTGAALDWAVAKCEGDAWLFEVLDGTSPPGASYHTDWALGGPIIEKYEIDLKSNEEGVWQASNIFDDMEWYHFLGYSPLVAAMRCYVASKLGDEVDVPEGLT